MQSKSLTEAEKSANAREILWRRGDLSWLLDANQEVLVNTFKNAEQRIIVWNLARGCGKSYALCVVALELCLKTPNALVKYACPKQKEASQIIQPLIRKITETCPDDIKPKFLKAEGAYRFKNGSQIQLSGLDNGRAEGLRGGSAHLAIVDEAASKSLKGTTSDLQYIIRSILIPAVIRTQDINGKIILASTPPISHDHPYVFYMRRGELNKSTITRTIYDNPRFTSEMLKIAIEESGGIDSSAFKREYLCQIVQSDEDAVIPEFEKVYDTCIKEWPRPPFMDWYVAMDVGWKDLTVVLFAYYDFRAKKLIIEDEFVVNGAKFNTTYLADNIKAKENVLLLDKYTGEYKRVYKRVSDTNHLVINDLYRLHGIVFNATEKHDADSALNEVRTYIGAGDVIINPRCETLIRHLRQATWSKNRKTFDRSADNGHYDAVDSLKYLIRNLDIHRNPYPFHFGIFKQEGSFFDSAQSQPKSQYASLVHKMMNFKHRGK